MYKQSFCLLLSTFAATAASAQGNITVKGHVTGDTKGFNKVYVYGQEIKTDSAVIKDGTFTLTIPYKPGIAPAMYTEYEAKVTRGVSPFPIIIDGPCDLQLNDVDITKGLSSGTWSGNPSAVAYQAFGKTLRPLSDNVNKQLQAKFPGGSTRDEAYRKEYDSLMKIGTAERLKTLVKSNPDLYAGAVLLRSNRSFLPIDDVKSIYGMLSAKQKASNPGKDVGDFLQGLKASAIGSTVQDFTLLTPEEKSFSFASLKGKYVLIDFWASWCGPCKASFPHMKEVYAKYKGDKFEIYSISIDKDKAAWLNELKKQDLPWKQTLDTKNISQSGFAITAVPTTYLVGPDGKIMMKEIGFDSSGNGALEKKLNELFMN